MVAGVAPAWAPTAAERTCECNATLVNGRRPFCSRSNGGEELFVYGLATALGLSAADGGTFVEAGGNDGWSTSNTNYLESCLGWHGALVEPEPRTFATMRRMRPDTLSIHSGICSAHGSSTLVRHVNRQPTGSMVMEPVLLESLSSSRRFRPLQWLFTGANAERVNVPCAPLSDVFSLVGLTRVDVLFLDVEGAESEALSSIDWEATSVGIVSIEFTRVNTTKNRHVLRQMQTANFSLVSCVREWTGNIYDLIFIRPEHFATKNVSAEGHATLPQAAEEWLARHHAYPSHDALRCKRVAWNETERLSFEITPPKALVQ